MRRKKPKGFGPRLFDFCMNEGPVVFFILIMAFYFMFCGQSVNHSEKPQRTEIVSLGR